MCEELGEQTITSVPISKFNDEMIPNVLFGFFIPRDEDRNHASQLLDRGVPLILLGKDQLTDKFTKVLKDAGFRRNINALTYPVEDSAKLRGAIHWVANYYHDIKELAIKANDTREKQATDKVFITMANNVIQQAIRKSS